MLHSAISAYRKEYSDLFHIAGKKESIIRRAMERLIADYAKPRNLILAPELTVVNRLTGKRNIPDGSLIDNLRLEYGYWEAKDQYDDLDTEIKTKFDLGYPSDNIFFEDGITGVLFLEGKEALRLNIQASDEDLHKILHTFVSYERKEVYDFRLAVERFKEEIPELLQELRKSVQHAHEINTLFQTKYESLLELCRQSIHPTITKDDVDEMILQHVLTEDIFSKIFDETQFHDENNISLIMRDVERSFLKGEQKRELIGRVKVFYDSIQTHASHVANHRDKQLVLKGVYEEFYKAYNPKAADRLGVVYTPNEIVRFMVESVENLLNTHFKKNIWSAGVDILDPATGTGTFICDLIDFIPHHHLKHKYDNEIHANELALLPYYIANLNIEYTYRQKMEKIEGAGGYREFKNLCFTDTLDNTHGLRYKGKALDMFAFSAENSERIKRQNERKISVIIGNPPYNANQQNENDNNKNRVYTDVDKRIKDTYIKNSTAQKTKLYDMYVRFIRWASDRLADEGIIAFITNRSYIDSRTFDGFRKVVTDEFNEIYIIDTRSDVRMNPKIAGMTHNVFGIQTGVAVMFLVKKKSSPPNALTTPNPSLKGGELHNEFPPFQGGDRGGKKEGAGKEVRGGEKPPCKIFYYTLTDEQLKAEKLEWFSSTKLENLPFDRIFPDPKNNWINLTNNDWDSLIPVCDKEVKGGKGGNAIFELFSLGVVTARDEWVYDFDVESLTSKVKYFCELFNQETERWKTSDKSVPLNDFVNRTIKWTEELERYMVKGVKLSFDKSHLISSSYRPFVKMSTYFTKVITHRIYQNDNIFGVEDRHTNLVIGFSGLSSNKPFQCFIFDQIFGHDTLEKTQCLPLYRYEKDGSRVENVSAWAVGLFRERYGISSPFKGELEGVKKTTPNPSLKGGELQDENRTQKGGEHVAQFPPFQGGIKGGEKGNRENLPGEVSNLKHLKETRKELRSNATPAEATLWKSLQKNQLQGRKFRRQHSIGNYVADFYCSEEKLVIELDGAEHFTSQGSEYDAERTEFMNQYGVRVLRFENKEVFESLDAVLKVIQDAFTIQKEDIFYYVYGVLHCPAYRTKYEQNLKRDFPRIPLYDDFWQWTTWGRQLADLHLNFETVEPYPLIRVEKEVKPKQDSIFDETKPLPKKPAIAKLKADKAKGEIIIDSETTLTGIPADAWEYNLGNRSALEWILDQYKESTPSDPTIREKFNTYRFANYKEKVIDLLQRVCTVSVETVKIVKEMPQSAE